MADKLECWKRAEQLEIATIVSISAFEAIDSEMAFVLLRPHGVTHPSELPMGRVRERLAEFSNQGAVTVGFVRPPPGASPVRHSAHDFPFAIAVFLTSALLREAIGSEGCSDFGALVADPVGPPSSHRTSLWAQAALWLGGFCAGSFRGNALRLLSCVAHLSRARGVYLEAPSVSPPCGNGEFAWLAVVTPPPPADVCGDIRSTPCRLSALASFIVDYPIAMFGGSWT